jgi:bifunctional non-homologous end joining protein LigD
VAAPHWAEPRLVAEITFSGWTASGLVRQSVWHRLRPDLTRLD